MRGVELAAERLARKDGAEANDLGVGLGEEEIHQLVGDAVEVRGGGVDAELFREREEAYAAAALSRTPP